MELRQSTAPPGYHPGNYSYPHTTAQRFEIWVGAILTQNCSWRNVEQALANLQTHALLKYESIEQLDPVQLSQYIRVAGFYNQKARKLKEATQLFGELQGACPSRRQLLSLWGIGPETADSILLYAYHYPIFVVDSYSRRILTNLRLINSRASYTDIQQLFTHHLKADPLLYQEYHALLVRHAKAYYRQPSQYADCPLLQQFGR